MCSFPFLRVRHRAIADDLGQDVRLAQDQDLVGSELDLGPAVLGEDDLVTLLDVHLDVLPVLVARAGTDREDLAALRLLLRGVGQHDAAGRDLFLFEDLHDQAVTKRLQIHSGASSSFRLCDTSWHSNSESANAILQIPKRCASEKDAAATTKCHKLA